MFGKKWNSLVSGVTLENPENDCKAAKRLGQYRISEQAIYKSNGGYIPLSSVTECIHDQTSVHVSGCCAGGVPVERIVFVSGSEKIPLIFDNKKQVEAVLQLVEAARNKK